MERRTNQILFISIILCMAVLACQLSPFENNRADQNKPDSKDNTGILQPLIDGFSGIISPPGQGINIGGIEPQGFSLVSQLGGSTVTIAADGDRAFLGQGPRVVALDVSNPDSPEVLGESPVLPGLVMGLMLEGDTLYTVAMYGGLHILDVSDPAKITVIGSAAPRVPGCDSLTIREKTAYMACNPGGLFIVDITSKEKPEILFEEEKSSGASFSIALTGDFAYMANASANSLNIFDIKNPAKPKKVGGFPYSDLPEGGNTGGFISSVRVCGTYLCLAAEQDGLILLNISDPSKPAIAGRLDTLVASGLAVDGNIVYLADDMEGIYSIDISDPAHPKKVGLLPTAVGGWELTVKEHGERGLFLDKHRLYITDQAYGLTISDMSSPESLERIGHYMPPLPDVLSDIRLDGKTAYVTGRNSGFRTVDISNPEIPKELFYDDARKNLYSQNPSGLIVRENLAYITDKNYPFRIYNVAKPEKPVELGALFDQAASDGAFDIVLNGDLAYLSGWGLKDAFYPGKGIWVVDIKNPDKPKAVNFVDVANEDWILALAKDHLYALDATMDLDHNGQKEPISLRVFDLSDPEKPKEVDTIPIEEARNLAMMDMTTDGERLYINIPPNGVIVYDLSKPESPKKTASIPIQGGMADVFVDGHYLFAGGISAYNILKPAKPEFAGLMGNLQAWDLAKEKDMVYVITTFQGLYIFRFDPLK